MIKVLRMRLFRLGRGEPIVDPWKYFVSDKPLPSNRVVMVFTSRLLNVAKRTLRNVNRLRRGELIAVKEGIVGEFDGEKVIVVLPYIGAPASVMVLETLIVNGGKVFIALGLAGAIKRSIRIGDVVIPTWGIREEGTSYHYMPPEYVPRPDDELANALYDEILNIGKYMKINVVKGGVWSIDAPSRETRDKVIKFSRRGVLAVDMESTALMTVAKYYGVKLAVVLAISDELYGKGWRHGFKSRRLIKAEKVIMEATLRVLTRSDLVTA